MNCSKKYEANLGTAQYRRRVGRLTVGVQLSVDKGPGPVLAASVRSG